MPLRQIALAALLLVALPAHAGGDYARGLVTSFSASGGQYSFTFTQPSRDRPLLGDCRQYRVSVRYTAFPSALDGSYPSEADTVEGAYFLKFAAAKGSLVHFGYMGGAGLTPAAGKCTYAAKALDFGHDDGTVFVLAYSNPI